ncbi:MAG: recG [Verrucomicrobiales bacterium]|nr:recG [Verrucomicrobiales bacterium]
MGDTASAAMIPAPNLLMNIETPVADLPFLDGRTQKALTAAGFTKVGEVLTHYPARYEDRRAFDGWPDRVEDEQTALCLRGVVSDVQLKRSGPRRSFVVLTLSPPALRGGLEGFARPLMLRWFNMPFVFKSFAADQELIVHGRPKSTKTGALIIDHPEYEILNDTDEEEAAIHLERIVPVYHMRGGVPQKTLRRAVHRILDHLEDGAVPDLLPVPSVQGEFAGQSRGQAWRRIHFPESMEAADRARRYLALEEFFVLQLQVLRRRRQWESLAGAAHCGPGHLMRRWLESLPFALTGAQQRSIDEIRGDLARPAPMNRLLQGDVGSGKTFVAMAAMLLAVESGCQAALMAPTQILAEQHYLNFRRWLEPLGVRIGLRTASKKEDAFLPLFSEGTVAGGDSRPQILIGTHALLHGDAELPELGLAVIDEQHKFGVEQRARLVCQGRAPDVLVMTATPIPRTLTMTVYGDLDVSLIDEMPAGRRPIVTAVREQPDLNQVASFLKQQFAAGRQAYLVYPLIDESESLDLKSAVKEHAFWEKKLAPDAVGLLHGRLSPAEKDEVMRRFRENDLQALVSTSVIEVGVDVPNASVMIVFEAERFGLAQLHQLRGRIGRGAHRSWCILTASGKNAEGLERLHILAKTNDGFEVAEADLRQRGPGDVLGTAQSGLAGLALGDPVRDVRLIRLARRLAVEVTASDPDFLLPKHASLRLQAEPESRPPVG